MFSVVFELSRTFNRGEEVAAQNRRGRSLHASVVAAAPTHSGSVQKENIIENKKVR